MLFFSPLFLEFGWVGVSSGLVIGGGGAWTVKPDLAYGYFFASVQDPKTNKLVLWILFLEALK